MAIISMIQGAALAVQLYASPWYWRQDYHTSALTGAMWVNELIYGHPERIRSCLGMRVHVYLALVAELRTHGLSDSRYVSLREKLAIFLYTCVTGLSIRHVGERFQRSNETISMSVIYSPMFSYFYLSHLLVAISKKCLLHFLLLDSIMNMSAFHPLMTLYLLKFATIHDGFHFSRVLLEQWMELTSVVAHQRRSGMLLGIGKAS
jgi:hypothetical protein